MPLLTAPRTNYGKLLRKIRRQKGMSVRELAKQIGVDHSYLSRIESNKVIPPTWARMAAIADVLDSYDLREIAEYQEFKMLLILTGQAIALCNELPDRLKQEINAGDINDLRDRCSLLMPKLVAAMDRRLKPSDWKPVHQQQGVKPGKQTKTPVDETKKNKPAR